MVDTGWRRLLALRPAMVDFDRRGFRSGVPATRATLEAAGRAFLTGFNLELATPADRAPDLAGLAAHHRGLAAEGAAMAATLLDTATPWRRRRMRTLTAAHGERYAYLIHVGVGWAMAKLHRSRPVRQFVEADAPQAPGDGEPLLRWLAYDGLGFCRAFFATEPGIRRWYRHAGRCDTTCEIRYQGLGRSLWFRDCGDPAALARRIDLIPTRHHGDVWSGAALAATYAGAGSPAADGDTYHALRRLAGTHAAAVAQGAAFGAEAWRRCGHVPAHARLAVPALAGVPVDEAARWTWDARSGLDRPGADATDYRRWRLRVQQRAARIAQR